MKFSLGKLILLVIVFLIALPCYTCRALAFEEALASIPGGVEDLEAAEIAPGQEDQSAVWSSPLSTTVWGGIEAAVAVSVGVAAALPSKDDAGAVALEHRR